MTTKPAFSATAWIAANTYGGTELSDEATSAVAHFTTMWNFFENVLCGNHASIAAFERIAQDIDFASAPTASLEALEQCLSFWKFRYQTPDGFANRFDGLYFRPKDRRDHVEAVLIGRRARLSDKALALMIIVYRLRNNLFHGLKTLDMLNDQAPNLDNASRCLAAILESARPVLVVPRARRTANR